MAYSAAVKIAVHTAVLDLLSTGSGTAGLKLMAGATELATIPLDHAGSSVDGTTGALTIVQETGGTTAVASGTVTSAQLLDRDGAILDDARAVQAGSSPVSGKVVLSSLTILIGGQVDLVSFVIG